MDNNNNNNNNTLPAFAPLIFLLGSTDRTFCQEERVTVVYCFISKPNRCDLQSLFFFERVYGQLEVSHREKCGYVFLGLIFVLMVVPVIKLSVFFFHRIINGGLSFGCVVWCCWVLECVYIYIYIFGLSFKSKYLIFCSLVKGSLGKVYNRQRCH